jgi:hypothetical protein
MVPSGSAAQARRQQASHKARHAAHGCHNPELRAFATPDTAALTWHDHC